MSVKNDLKQYSARSSRSHCPQTGYGTSCPLIGKIWPFSSPLFVFKCILSFEEKKVVSFSGCNSKCARNEPNHGQRSPLRPGPYMWLRHKSQFDSGIQFQRHFVLIERFLYTFHLFYLHLYYCSVFPPNQKASCLMWQLNFSSKSEIPAFYNSNLNHRRTAFSPLYLIRFCFILAILPSSFYVKDFEDFKFKMTSLSPFLSVH